MFKLLRTRNKRGLGFSLVELLVVLLIMSIMASVAIPLYLNQQKRSSLSLAQSDATSTGEEINSLVGDYTNFGTTTGTITFPGGVATFSPMTGATGNGPALSAGPGATTSIVKLSPNSTASGTYGTGTSTPWCIVITNNGTYAQYTNTGLAASQVGGTAPTCVNGLAVAGSSGAGGGAVQYSFTSIPSGAYNVNMNFLSGSSDVTKLTMINYPGDIFTSTNSGTSWADQTGAPSTNWTAVAESSDGTKQVAVGNNGNGIYTSTDSGVTWSQRAGAGAGPWQTVASSADGQTLAASQYIATGIYVSTDAGVTWTQHLSTVINNFQFIVINSNGTKLAANTGGAGTLYTSTDSGSTWTLQTSSPAVAQTSLSQSSDGAKLEISAPGGGVFFSIDGGSTWTERDIPVASRVIYLGSDAAGAMVVALDAAGDMYTTTDLGTTWTLQTGLHTTGWGNMVLSSDGKKIAVEDWNANSVWIGVAP